MNNSIFLAEQSPLAAAHQATIQLLRVVAHQATIQLLRVEMLNQLIYIDTP
jgi:hypothetical protein